MLSKLRELAWLTKMGPSFGVPSKNIQIIQEPSVFFDTLNSLALISRQRIVLAALYLGTGDREKKLVQNLRDALVESHKDGLRMTVLLDYTRGSRGEVSSRTILTPIVKEFGSEKVRVALYHSPKLRGFLRWLLPPKYNEVVGLQHIKVYIFDDTVIMSGANLSDQYFDKRQDRYIMFKDSPELADYYTNLVEAVADCSFQVDGHNQLSLIDPVNLHPYRTDLSTFIRNARDKLERFMRPTEHVDHTHDTVVFPLIQMDQLDLGNDRIVTSRLLRDFSYGSLVKLATGYFNMIPEYEELVVTSPAVIDIATAHPKANSFYGAAKPLCFIPDMYTYLLKLFYSRTKKLDDQVNLWEYFRDGWTFHAKGLWYYPSGKSTPVMTMIGSPNFGYRSVSRDLESQVIIYTSSPELRAELHKEQENIFTRSSVVTDETFENKQRTIPWWIPSFASIARSFF